MSERRIHSTSLIVFSQSSTTSAKISGPSTIGPEYQPHITITWDGRDIDLANVEPYTGPIVLGPEIFAEVVEDWEKTISEVE